MGSGWNGISKNRRRTKKQGGRKKSYPTGNVIIQLKPRGIESNGNKKAYLFQITNTRIGIAELKPFEVKIEISEGVEDGSQQFIRNNTGELIDTEHRYIRYIPVQHEVLVAVVDIGIETRHKSLNAAIYKNPREIPGNGIDDDGNGLVDDVEGWDFSDYKKNKGNADPSPSQKYDIFGRATGTYDNHGTMVAGIIAGQKDDKVNFSGVNPNAKILNVKNRDHNPASSMVLTDSSYAIRYAVDMGAKVINCSFGLFGGENLKEAVAYAIARGVMVVVSAGNSGKEVWEYPQLYPDTVVVAGHNELYLRYGSNYGSKVTFSAFSVNVFTLGLSSIRNGYTSDTGTSLAAPIISAIASRLFGNDPTLSREQVLAKMKQYSIPMTEHGMGVRIDSEALTRSIVDIETLYIELECGKEMGAIQMGVVREKGTRRVLSLHVPYLYFKDKRFSVHREV